MDGDKNITATFINPIIPIFSLNVTTSGSGIVIKYPDLPLYLANSMVLLSANPDAGSHFTGWSGDVSGPESTVWVLMNGNKSIIANFSSQPVRPLVTGDGTGSDGKSPHVHDVKVYPNPFIDKIKIELTSKTAAKTAKVIVTTIDGKTVYQKEVKLIKGRISQDLNGLSRLPPGMYILMLQLDERTIMKKVMKQ